MFWEQFGPFIKDGAFFPPLGPIKSLMRTTGSEKSTVPGITLDAEKRGGRLIQHKQKSPK
jgi:hypothetical protein